MYDEDVDDRFEELDDNFDIEESDFLDSELEDNFDMSEYNGYGSSVDLDKITDEQLDLYDMAYHANKDD